jgi:hypothetical protein
MHGKLLLILITYKFFECNKIFNFDRNGKFCEIMPLNPKLWRLKDVFISISLNV